MTSASSNSEQMAMSPLPARFSYSDLAPEAAHIARTAAASIRRAHAGFFREIGAHLLQVKVVLPHGSFTAWVETELRITDRTARNYMQAAMILGADLTGTTRQGSVAA